MSLSGPEAGFAIVLVVVIGIPLAAMALGWAGRSAGEHLGEDEFSISYDSESSDSDGGEVPIAPAVRREEIRQMVQARSDRAEARGERPINVEAEVERLLDGESGDPGEDATLREEVRQIVVARNERLARQGKQPLEIEDEVERRLRELESITPPPNGDGS